MDVSDNWGQNGLPHFRVGRDSPGILKTVAKFHINPKKRILCRDEGCGRQRRDVVHIFSFNFTTRLLNVVVWP